MVRLLMLKIGNEQGTELDPSDKQRRHEKDVKWILKFLLARNAIIDPILVFQNSKILVFWEMVPGSVTVQKPTSQSPAQNPKSH
jgi:hypothetical protein